MGSFVSNRFDWLSYKCKYSVVFLAFSWVLGLLLGVLISSKVAVFYSSLMHAAVYTRVTIVGSLIGNLLPLILSYIVIRIQQNRLLLPIAFFKSLFSSIVSGCILISFPDGGWLLRYILMFSQISFSVFLLWFWIKHFRKSDLQLDRDVLFLVLVALGISLIDYHFVSALLIQIIN